MKTWILLLTVFVTGCATQHPLTGMIPKDAVAVAGSSGLQGVKDAFNDFFKPMNSLFREGSPIRSDFEANFQIIGIPMDSLDLTKPWALSIEYLQARTFLGKDPWLTRLFLPVKTPWSEGTRDTLKKNQWGSWYEGGYEILTNAWDPGAKPTFPLQNSLDPDSWQPTDSEATLGFYGNIEALGKALGLPFQMLPTLLKRAVEAQNPKLEPEITEIASQVCEGLGQGIKDISSLRGTLKFNAPAIRIHAQVHFKSESFGEKTVANLENPKPITLNWAERLSEDTQAVIGLNLSEKGSQFLIQGIGKYLEKIQEPPELQGMTALLKDWESIQFALFLEGPFLWYQKNFLKNNQALWFAHPKTQDIVKLHERWSEKESLGLRITQDQDGLLFQIPALPHAVKKPQVDILHIHEIPKDSLFFFGFQFYKQNNTPHFLSTSLRAQNKSLLFDFSLDWAGLQETLIHSIPKETP